MSQTPSPRRGHPADRVAVARKARAIHSHRPVMFTADEWRVQLKFFIENNLARLTRARAKGTV